MTTAVLPKPDTKRWTLRSKRQVLSAILSGELPLEKACSQYRLIPPELGEWWRQCGADF